MPKQTVDRQEILDIALQMTREDGFESVNARSVARRMGYSVQPIYSYFSNMDSLKEAVYGAAMGFYNKFIYSRVDGDRILESMAKDRNAEFHSIHIQTREDAQNAPSPFTTFSFFMTGSL